MHNSKVHFVTEGNTLVFSGFLENIVLPFRGDILAIGQRGDRYEVKSIMHQLDEGCTVDIFIYVQEVKLQS